MKDKEIAILMAAGMGTRMRPLTDTIPKPLVKVKGIPMIETVIDALNMRGVSHMYVVTGYLGEQFDYLKEKYNNITLVENKEYTTVNNISSVHAVTMEMGGFNCFICEADLYIPSPDILMAEHDKSCYYGKMIKGHSDDWLFIQDKGGRIVHVIKGGDDCYNMCGISYFLKEDARVIADAIEERYKHPGYEGLFWDEVVDSVLDKVELFVYPVNNNSIVEIDTVEELEEVEKLFVNASSEE